MKNKSHRNFLIVFLVIFSFASFAYVNSNLVSKPDIELKTGEIEINEMTKQSEATLPDVKFVKKATEFIINMLPISR